MRNKAIVAAMFAVGFASSALAGPFTAGDVVIYRVGNGTQTLSGTGNTIFLDEYSPLGVLVQSIALPDTGSAALISGGTSTSEGLTSLSQNGQFLSITGYNTDIGGAAALATSGTVARSVAVIDFNGNVIGQSNFTDANGATPGNIRSATTTNGSDVWFTNSTGGIHYGVLGATTSLQIASTPTNLRQTNIYNGQLYVSSATGAFQGVSTVGTGTPTTNGQTITLLPGFPTTSGPSNYDFWFADANTAYVADDRTAALGGGLQKWVQSGGTWSLQYTLTGGLTGGLRGMAGSLNGNVATFFATSADSANRLVTIQDDITNTSASGSFTVLATAGTNIAFRGIDYVPTAPVPEPATLAILGVGAIAMLRRRRAR